MLMRSCFISASIPGCWTLTTTSSPVARNTARCTCGHTSAECTARSARMMYTETYTHACVCQQMRVRTHTHTHTHHARKHAAMHANTLPCTRAQAHAHAYARVGARMPARVCTHKRTRTFQMRSYAHTPVQSTPYQAARDQSRETARCSSAPTRPRPWP
jgi:hypothetical protein